MESAPIAGRTAAVAPPSGTALDGGSGELLAAVRSADLGAVEAALMRGADPNVEDGVGGGGAAMLAAARLPADPGEAIVTALLAAGADVGRRDPTTGVCGGHLRGGCCPRNQHVVWVVDHTVLRCVRVLRDGTPALCLVCRGRALAAQRGCGHRRPHGQRPERARDGGGLPRHPGSTRELARGDSNRGVRHFDAVLLGCSCTTAGAVASVGCGGCLCVPLPR